MPEHQLAGLSVYNQQGTGPCWANPQEPNMAHTVSNPGGDFERKNSCSPLLRDPGRRQPKARQDLSLVTYWPHDGKLSLGFCGGRHPHFFYKSGPGFNPECRQKLSYNDGQGRTGQTGWRQLSRREQEIKTKLTQNEAKICNSKTHFELSY